MTASDENEILTADDIAGLNRQAVLRAAAFTRLAGAALVIADYSVARTGGSLTGFEPGDRA